MNRIFSKEFWEFYFVKYRADKEVKIIVNNIKIIDHCNPFVKKCFTKYLDKFSKIYDSLDLIVFVFQLYFTI